MCPRFSVENLSEAFASSYISFLTGCGTETKKPAAERATTYSESFQEDVLNQNVTVMPSNYVYGEKPVERIEDYEPTESEVYSVRENAAEPSADYTGSETEYSDALHETAETPSVEPVEEKSENFYEALNTRASEQITPEVAPQPEINISAERHTEEESRSVLDYFRQPESDEPDEEEVQSSDSPINMYNLFGPSGMVQDKNTIEPDVTRLGAGRALRSNADLFDYDDDDDDETVVQNEQPMETASRVRLPEERKPETVTVKPAVQATKTEPVVQEEKPKHVWKKYVHPTLDLLDDYPEHNNVNTGEIEDNKRTIVDTLARFKIASEVSNVTIGPAITRYDVIIEDKTKIKQSLNYREAVAMALMKENVTAYLNYSKGALSIERKLIV